MTSGVFNLMPGLQSMKCQTQTERKAGGPRHAIVSTRARIFSCQSHSTKCQFAQLIGCRERYGKKDWEEKRERKWNRRRIDWRGSSSFFWCENNNSLFSAFEGDAEVLLLLWWCSVTRLWWNISIQSSEICFSNHYHLSLIASKSRIIVSHCITNHRCLSVALLITFRKQ